MVKNTIALCCALAAGPALAQSSVTIFGTVDAAVTRLSGSGNGHRLGMSSGGEDASRLGFRGREDLGGGLSANFWLEGGLLADSGNPNGFNFLRRSTVGLAGNFGEIRLGRDYAPTFSNSSQYSAFGVRGVGRGMTYNNFGIDGVRNSNSVAYFLPRDLGGFHGTVQYAFGEKQSNTRNDKQGNVLGARFGYAKGPAEVAVAYSRYKQMIGASDVAPIVIGRDFEVANLGGSWDFGWARLLGFVGREKVIDGPVGNSQLDSYQLSAIVPVGAGKIKALMSHHDRKDSANDFSKIALGYSHSLSKRTELYTTVARVRNKGTSTQSFGLDGLTTVTPLAGRSATGFEMGVRHKF